MRWGPVGLRYVMDRDGGFYRAGVRKDFSAGGGWHLKFPDFQFAIVGQTPSALQLTIRHP